MDGPEDYHTKWSKRKKNAVWYCSYVKSKKKKNDKNELTKQKHTHRLQRQTDGYQRGKVGEWNK